MILRTFAFALVPLLVGTGFAEATYHFTWLASYDSKCATLGSYDLHWLYFSAVMLGIVTRVLNLMGAFLKNAAMATDETGAKGNIRANMYLFKDTAGGLVVLEDEGKVGRYNRANRSLHHFTENALPVFLCVPLAGFVFPLATFVLTLLFSVGRIAHQVGYSNKGYGGHGLGFLISTVSTIWIEGLVLIGGLKAAGANV
jgi:hypothetical protein